MLTLNLGRKQPVSGSELCELGFTKGPHLLSIAFLLQGQTIKKEITTQNKSKLSADYLESLCSQKAKK